MSVNQQSAVFKKILEDLEKVCDLNKQIKESVEAVNVENQEDVEKSYENLCGSLERSEKAFSEIVVYFKKSRDAWLGNRNKDEPVGETKDEKPIVVNGTAEPKVGMLKLVSIEKLLDPSRLNEKKNEEAVIVLSDGETENVQPQKNCVQLRKMLSARLDKGMKTVRSRTLRHRNNFAAKSVILDSDSESEEERQNSKSRRRRKQNADTEFVVQKKGRLAVADKQIDGSKKYEEKFCWRAFISLPRVPCEKLKEYYLNKPDVFLPMKKFSKTKKDKSKKSDSTNVTQKQNITLQSLLDSSADDSMDIPFSDIMEQLGGGPAKKTNDGETLQEAQKESVNNEELVENAKETEDSEKTSEICDTEIVGGETIEAEVSQDTDKQRENSDIEKEDAAKQNKETSDEPASVEETKEDSNTRDENKQGSEDEKQKSDNDEPKKSKKRVRFQSDEEEQKGSSDSEDFDFAKFNARKDQEKKSKLKKKKIVFSSDSEEESTQVDAKKTDDVALSSESEAESQEEKTKSRRRIKRVRDSSSSDGSSDKEDSTPEKSTRKQIRKVIGKSALSESTKLAEKEENERKARILEKQKKYNQIFDAESLKKSTVDKIVLDFDDETKKELLTVHKDLVKHLKPHQAAGVKFMWDACFESLERAKKAGSGCILAHCMGLGKTLQVITLSHTLLMNSDKTGVEKVMVVCPLNTVLNWVDEFKQWLPKSSGFEVFEIVSHKQNSGRQYIVSEWFREGGVLIIGYDMFRNLTNESNKRMTKKMRNEFQKALVDPGPDVVVCDEGHLLKNEKTNLSIAMNRLKTLRRIVLTGTPLQNNLKEYYCMVQFVKPNLLGTYKEYLNRFVNPITNGQYTDSTPMDIHIMRRRSHVLHKLLDGLVQRNDYNVLAPYLPPKHEYVLFLSLSEKQIELYRYYMDNIARNQDSSMTKGRTSFLFTDFQEFQRICTHPKVLQDKSFEMREKRNDEMTDEDSEGSLKDFIDDGEEDEAKSTSSGSDSDNSKSGSDSSIKSDTNKKRKTRVTRASAAAAGGIDEIIKLQEEETRNTEWFDQFLKDEDFEDIKISAKLFLLFEILNQCEAIGDKILVFSQSLYSLNVIEYFLQKVDEATQNGSSCCGFTGSWALGLDYFRIDGSSSCDNRAAWCRTFNDPENIRARLFLISTRAGGLGINLVAANRVIIFDVSWNPSHDTQSIYRVYRFGQTKPSYIYRFVTFGTMEMKVYERQVTKQAISKRVIDEQQIDRHYNQNDLMELYKFEPRPEGDRPIPLVPKDVLLGEILQNFPERIYKYHEHQSLLENKEDEVLDEEERKAAWEEFENEKTIRTYNTGTWLGLPTNQAMNVIRQMLHNEYPQVALQDLAMMVPAKMKQIEEEIKASNTETYAKITAEIRLQTSQQEQKLREYYLQQHAMKMMQQQFALAGQAQYLQALQQMREQQQRANIAGRSGVHVLNTTQPPVAPNEVIDLND